MNMARARPTHADGQLLVEGVRTGKRLNLLRMGPGCGRGMGVRGGRACFKG